MSNVFEFSGSFKHCKQLVCVRVCVQWMPLSPGEPPVREVWLAVEKDSWYQGAL